MVYRSFLFRVLMVISVLLMLPCSCVKNSDFDQLKVSCEKELVANTTFTQIFNLYDEETIQIQEDLIIEGYVISSDEAGNFFGVLHFQDDYQHPTEGLQIELDIRDSHLFYPIGSKVFIKLKGLYLGKSKGVYKIGGVFSSFGNVSVGRLPAPIVNQHIFISCEQAKELAPTSISLQDSLLRFKNTLVQIEQIEFSSAELMETYAVKEQETDRILIDCLDKEIVLRNSGYSDFQNINLPKGSGSITGVLLQENDDYFLVVRDTNDLKFDKERCEDFVDEFTSNSIFISEIADPENNADARFIELYNSGASLNLKNWRLLRYTNANTTVGATINLSGIVLEANTTLVISPNEKEFNTIYGFTPDMEVATGSAADSNGDDILVLVDPFDTVIDIFGVIGTDGSGTNHEFEDGRALRKPEINKGNTAYSFDEWLIYNDTGASGTINMPQQAPVNFTPGIR